MKLVVNKWIAFSLFFINIFSILKINAIKQTAPQVDLVVFSYDRPMQLYAFLESVHYYITGLATISVIYRSSTDDYSQAYSEVNKTFPTTLFIEQKPPYKDLKRLTLNAVFKTENPYILFGVDDIIVKDFIDLEECAQALEKFDSYGFFLSLGKHLTYCYSMNRPQKLPPLQDCSKNICKWHFAEGEYDWQYPNCLDMTLYRKSDLSYYLHQLDYSTPNRLEYELATRADMNQYGLCYHESKVLNFPLNMVQTDFTNAHTGSYSPHELLMLFNKGLKIDIKLLHKFINNARHISDYTLINFMSRKQKGEFSWKKQLN